MATTISYAQRFEDLHLLRCFGDQAQGFYIDIGAGHPIVDNVSFAFYLKGWRGITVEPNPYLARLTRAVRPRDAQHQLLVGAASGEATFYQVEGFHGFSTTIAAHAQRASTQFGKASEKLSLPVMTLQELCAQYGPAAIDFLKVDVEGAEGDVLRGGDWQNFRPKLVVVEALAPYTLEPAWHEWEPLLLAHSYRYVFFDNLNRYYVASEAAGLAERFAGATEAVPDTVQFGTLRPALDEPRHPDHPLAKVLTRAAMTCLPLLDTSVVADLLTAELKTTDLAMPATPADVVAAWERLFGFAPRPEEIESLGPIAGTTLAEIYARIAGTDRFRMACGRISASYAW